MSEPFINNQPNHLNCELACKDKSYSQKKTFMSTYYFIY